MDIDIGSRCFQVTADYVGDVCLETPYTEMKAEGLIC